MTRILRQIGLVLLGTVCCLLLAAWLLIATRSGSLWLLEQLLLQSPIPVSVATIEGRLADRLVLHEIRSSWDDGTFEIDELTLEWSPWSLLQRSLTVEQLSVGTLTLHLTTAADDSVSSPPRLLWPELPAWLADWQLHLGSLEIEKIRLQRPTSAELIVERLSAAVRLQEGLLVVDDLKAMSTSHSLSGNLELGLLSPSLNAGLTYVSLDEQQGEASQLTLKLAKGENGNLLSGPVEAKIALRGEPEYRLNATLHLAPDHLELEALHLERSAATGTAKGQLRIDWSSSAVRAESDLTLHDWLLAMDSAAPLVINGQLSGAGDSDAQRGHFDLSLVGEKWRTGTLQGDWSGESNSLSADIRSGRWLGGEIRGSVHSSWGEQTETMIKLTGRRLDPAGLSADWNGSVNLSAEVGILNTADDLRVTFDAAFADSLLRGLPLYGSARGAWQEETLTLDHLDLRGDGFAVQASGSLAERLTLNLAIDNLGGLIPQTAGRVRGRGWVGYRKGEWLGDFAAEIDQLRYDTLSIDAAHATLSRPDITLPAALHLEASGAAFASLQLQKLQATVTGDAANYALELSATVNGEELRAAGSGARTETGWRGTLSKLSLTDELTGSWQLAEPVTLQSDENALDLGSLRLHGHGGELTLAGRFDRHGKPLQLEATVRQLPLQIINPLLTPWQLAGTLEADLTCNARRCQLTASGLEAISHNDNSLHFDKVSLDGDWDESGLVATGQADATTGGHLVLQAKSEEPWLWVLPSLLTWRADWSDIPLLGHMKAPQRLAVKGLWQGHAEGRLDGQLFSSDGQAEAVGGSLTWHDEDSGEIAVNVDEARLSWQWRGDTLQGNLSLGLEDRGQLAAEWQLPLPASWPVAPRPDGRVQARLDGRLEETGLVGLLFPEIVQETQGEILINASLSGNWAEPALAGNAVLRKGGAYLPAPGILLQEVGLEVRFDGEQLHISNLTALSLPGKLSGEGTITLHEWRPKSFALAVRGDNVTLAHLPELQILASPDLKLTGTAGEMSLTGEITIPSFLASARSERNPVSVSHDVIVIDAEREHARELATKLSTRVRLILGDQVLVKMFGLDARLGGQLELTGIDAQHFSGQGEINVKEGTYTAYGVKLKIEKGRATYAGGPLDNPAIDILALKKTGEVRAGVQIRGTAKAPEAQLYAEPAMADTDILSYIVLGRPLSQAGGETDLLMLAAGALLSAGDSAVLRSRLQNQLGIDTFEAESSSGQTSDTVLRLGKYLTPDIYLSYGYALFGRQSEVGLRYRFLKGWEAESKFGVESGADLYYRFEFE